MHIDVMDWQLLIGILLVVLAAFNLGFVAGAAWKGLFQ